MMPFDNESNSPNKFRLIQGQRDFAQRSHVAHKRHTYSNQDSHDHKVGPILRWTTGLWFGLVCLLLASNFVVQANGLARYRRQSEPGGEEHDDKHPDHISDDEERNKLMDSQGGVEPDPIPSADKDLSSAIIDAEVGPTDGSDPSDPESTSTVERHRKVYLTPRTKEEESAQFMLNPIVIHIPLDPQEADSTIPAPAHFYKMRKFTSYENVPEVQMIPMTTTVVKPTA